TGTDGVFHLKLVKGGDSVFWVLPEDFAPRQIVSGTQRGDMGEVRVETGERLSGEIVDASGQPVSGVWVNAIHRDAQRETSFHGTAGRPTIPVATFLRRSTLSDSGGRFELGPLEPGPYRLLVRGFPEDWKTQRSRYRRADLPCAFLPQVVELSSG